MILVDYYWVSKIVYIDVNKLVMNVGKRIVEKGRFFFIVECELINGEGIMRMEIIIY